MQNNNSIYFLRQKPGGSGETGLHDTPPMGNSANSMILVERKRSAYLEQGINKARRTLEEQKRRITLLEIILMIGQVVFLIILLLCGAVPILEILHGIILSVFSVAH